MLRHAIPSLFFVVMAFVSPQSSSAQTIELIGLQTPNQLESVHLATPGKLSIISNELSDAELADVSAGDLEFALGEFDVFVSDNEAGFFTMDIAQQAFGGAEGIFTTVQAVNSAVDLNLIVNIYLNQQAL